LAIQANSQLYSFERIKSIYYPYQHTPYRHKYVPIIKTLFSNPDNFDVLRGWPGLVKKYFNALSKRERSPHKKQMGDFSSLIPD